MNKVKSTLALMIIISLAALAGRSFTTPENAAMNNAAVKNYLRQGFTLDAVNATQNFYIMQPTGDYAWGSVTVELHGKTGGPMSLETTYATVTCYIEAQTKNGSQKYVVTGHDLVENIVY